MCEEKQKSLTADLMNLTKEDVCLAFSGGIDSSLLLKLLSDCSRFHHTKVYAVLFDTCLHPRADEEIAKRVAKECDIPLFTLTVNEIDNPALLNNPIDRCYLCKKYLFERLIEFAKAHGVSTIIEGTNADDLKLYRPGIKAVKELGIKSPLADAALSKEEIRSIARALLISVADRPAKPCMATRIPYNTKLDVALLKKLEEGETYLEELGYQTARLRLYQDILRIEIKVEKMYDFMEQRDLITERLKQLGFCYITLDMEGFRSGSMDLSPILERNGN